MREKPISIISLFGVTAELHNGHPANKNLYKHHVHELYDSFWWWPVL